MVFMETPILIAMTKAMTCLVWHHVTHEVTHDAQKRPSSAAPLGFASSPGATAVGTASEFFSLSERATEVLNWFDFLIFQSWGLYPLGRFWEKNIRVYILIMSPLFLCTVFSTASPAAPTRRSATRGTRLGILSEGPPVVSWWCCRNRNSRYLKFK